MICFNIGLLMTAFLLILFLYQVNNLYKYSFPCFSYNFFISYMVKQQEYWMAILMFLCILPVNPWCLKNKITQSQKVRAVDYSPDGTMLAYGLENNTVRIIDAFSYYTRFQFNAGAKPNVVKFNQAGTYLIAGLDGGNIQVLNISANTNTTTTIPSGQSKVIGADFNNDSSVFVTCGDNNQLRTWNGTTFSTTFLSTIPDQTPKFLDCQFTSNNSIIYGDDANAVKIINPPYTSVTSPINSATYSGPVGCVSNRYTTLDYVAVDGSGKKVWASNSGTSLHTSANNINACSYARTLDYFMAGGDQFIVYIFNATNRNNTLIQSLPVTNKIKCADFSNDGKYLAVGTEDFFVWIYQQNCVSCGSSSFFNTTSKQCQLCSNYLEGCGWCSIHTSCQMCIQSYYLNTNRTCSTCHSALFGCSVCTNSTYCNSPLAGFYVSTGTVATCQSAMPGCLICNSSTVCLECHNQYYLNGTNKCQSCVSLNFCLKCYNSSYCTQCEMGYYPNGTSTSTASSCLRCSTNCLDCQGPALCYQCVLGYYTTGANCLACSANCLACNNTNFCIDCMTGYFVSSTGACTACTTPCLSCSSTATTCLSCYPGFYFNGISTCTLCPGGCSTCTSSVVCLTCVEGYYFVSANSTCIQCSTTYPNCQSCNSTNCTTCLTSFYYDSTSGQCKSCSTSMHGCILCSNSATCLFCSPGHYLSTTLTGNNSCQPCSVGCSTCETVSNCTSCVPGYYFDSAAFTCPKCTSKCATCSGTSTFCLSCVIGYHLSNAGTGTCTSCNATSGNCLACIYDAANVLQCIQCGVGFFLNSGSCQRCGSNCVTCSALSACLSCQLGFYLNSTDNTCRTCSPGCSECSVNGTCESCHVGYYLSTPNCLPCTNIGCLTCGADLKCLSCVAGYYLNTTSKVCTVCNSQLTNCLHCSSNTTCTQCAYGFALTTSGANTICSTCSTLTGCFHCTTLSNCLSCQSGYYLAGTTCSACLEGCRTCSNSTYCLSCGSSYFSGNILGGANLGTCLRCQFYLSGCELCQNNTDCTNCQTGYYLTTSGTNSVCKLCQVSIPNCYMCNTSATCQSCKGGYYLNSNGSSCIQCSTTFSACRLCDRLGTVCTDCQSSYYLSSGNCLLCSGNIPGCQICSGPNTCLQCSSGYFLNSTVCTMCTTPIPGCIFCNNSNVCLQCEAGYYLDSVTFKCVPCSVVGCQICVQSNSSQCVTCNSLYYKSSLTSCDLCRNPIEGCLTCTGSTSCTKCDVGYYQLAVPTTQCLLCSSAIEGCSICSSSTVCLQCKSMYFLNSTGKCQICSVPMTGCTFCTNNTICLSCGSGYFKNTTNLCQSCTDLPGCLVCKDASTCLFCDTGYFFSSFTCQSCNIISGCYSCISSTICTSCIGGYTLNTNSGCDVAQVQANVKVTDLLLKTFYVNSTTLKHFLYVKNLKFTKKTIDWAANLNLFIFNNNGNKIPLKFLNAQWPSDNNYTLVIYTDNPIDYNSRTKKMPFARRRLSFTLDLDDSKTGIEISDFAIQQILPEYQHVGSLVIDYGLNNPQFYVSYTKEAQIISTFPFWIFGVIFVGICAIKYLLKALATVPKSTDIGNIMPHIFAFKVGALLLFPTYFEYINYCSGFMYADFPWLNRFFGEKLSDSRDTTPEPYSLFYDNMNLASMYLLPLSIFILLVIITALVGKSMPEYSHKMNSTLQFLYNFFSFGMIFAGCASLQGAIMNPIESVNINGSFYILGILVYFSLMCECIYKLVQDRCQNFWKLRVFIKATLLSLSHHSPVYLLASTVVVDIILLIAELQINPHAKKYCVFWTFANVTCNLSLILLVFLPIIMLTMVLVSVFLLFALIAEAVIHYRQARWDVSAKSDPNDENDQRNIWDLNLTDKQIKKTESYDKSKENFMKTNTSEFKMTGYPQDDQGKRQDLDETQVFSGNYKRYRKFKKGKEDKQGHQKSIKIDLNNKSNPNHSQDQMDKVKEQKNDNLMFMMEDVEN